MTLESTKQVARSDEGSQSAVTSLWVSVDPASPGTSAVASGNRARLDRRRTALRCAVVVSLASFIVGVVVTTVSFAQLFQSPAVVGILQVINLRSHLLISLSSECSDRSTFLKLYDSNLT